MKLKNKYISRVYQLIEDRSQMGHLTEITQSCVFQSVVYVLLHFKQSQSASTICKKSHDLRWLTIFILNKEVLQK